MSQGNSTTYNHTLTQAQLDELQFQHKYNVLQYNSNQVTTSSAQAYANTINGGSNGGRTFATQSHSYTNPNTLNLQRWGYTATNNGGQLVCGNTNNYEEDIQTNADNIQINSDNIQINSDNIQINSDNIQINTTNIETNTTNIATIPSIYETKANASATYETKTNASATYETKANASATYETIDNASLLAPKDSPQLTGNLTLTSGDLIFPDGTTQTTAYTGPTPAPIAGLGANYKMPFHVFGSSDGAVKSFPLNVFQMELTPNGWSRFDKIYLKVNMRHMTTFNDNVSPNTVRKRTRGYFDGVWILSPSSLRNPAVASSIPVFDSPNDGTGNPISGGIGFGVGAIDTSNVYNSDYFYREMGSTVDGDWGSENNNNNQIVSFYLYISGDSTAQFIWRYLYNDIEPETTRNQDMSGTIEILSAVNSNTVGGTGGNLTLKAYNINGGYTFNDTHSIITI
jgi:hypothetical protein